uniref:Secreted protein n=1 Tax=Globodera pallida TaxID=36090 RepID=A0A183CSJ9_GLOPA
MIGRLRGAKPGMRVVLAVAAQRNKTAGLGRARTECAFARLAGHPLRQLCGIGQCAFQFFFPMDLMMVGEPNCARQ